MTKPSEIEIHPGHWKASNSGANGILNEVTENRKVAKKVYELLKASGVPCSYFEDNASTNQRDNINVLLKEHNKDMDGLIVSIHFNSSGATTNKPIGTEVLYHSEKTLATKIVKTISDATGGGLLNRGAKQRTDLGVLAKTYEPAVLIEVCFVNSSVDAAIYRRDFDKICAAIARELAAHIGYNMDKKPTDNKATFLSKITTGIKDCWTKHQILPSVVLAQSILESGWGTSDKALKANNLFGIKANSDWKGPTVTLPTQEHINGKWITIDAKWRKYGSWSDCLVDHATFLSKPRYKMIIGNADYKSVCQALQNAGYATDPTYASKLIGVIESNDLTKYDEVDELKFSSQALEQKVNTLLNDKNTQKEMIEKGIAAKAFNEVWRDKFNKGELAQHDILGLSALYAAVK